MEELWKSRSDGFLPVLVEIYNPDLKWADGTLDQENMYLRVINDKKSVKYKGKTYVAGHFNYVPPEENGKSIGGASLEISALDYRVVQMLRSVEVPCEVTIVAGFAKEGNTYTFIPLENLTAKMSSASYNRTTARLELTVKDSLKLSIPRDVATQDKLPSVNTND